MKTKTNEPEKIALVNHLAHEAFIEQQYNFDETLPDLFTGTNPGNIPEEKNAPNHSPLPNKRTKRIRRLLKVLLDEYGSRKKLMSLVDEWIKFVALHIDEENHIGSQEYLDLLFFLFTFKETLQKVKKTGHLADELLDLVYGLYGRKYLGKEIDRWARFVALCTEKEHHTGSKEYLGLLKFLFVFKDGLRE